MHRKRRNGLRNKSVNKITRYYRLNWDNGGYVIIKRYGKARIFNYRLDKINNSLTIPTYANVIFGYCIYGSRRKYETSGNHLYFTDVKSIEELTPEYVAKEYFIGLL